MERHVDPVAPTRQVPVGHGIVLEPVVDLRSGERRGARVVPSHAASEDGAGSPPWAFVDAIDAVGRTPRFGVPVLFDVTAGDLARPALTAHLAPLADRTGADRLVLRLILDQPIHSPLRARQTVRALRRLGVGLVLSDFGYGWSNLAALRHLLPDAVEVRLDTLRRWDDPARGLEWICRLVRSVSGGPTIATAIAEQPDATWALEHGAVLGHGPCWPGHEISETGWAAIAARARPHPVR